MMDYRTWIIALLLEHCLLIVRYVIQSERARRALTATVYAYARQGYSPSPRNETNTVISNRITKLGMIIQVD